MPKSLTERERQVLEAVIETYVETAEPAGSRTISKRFAMALSSATIRNTMSDVVRTSLVEVTSRMAAEAIAQVAVVLNERLGGLTLRQIRTTLSDRLRDAASDSSSGELLNIFIQEADELFDVPATGAAAAG